MTDLRSFVPSSGLVATLLALWLSLSGRGAWAQSTNQPLKVPDWVALDANIPYDAYEQTVLDVLRPKAESRTKRPGVVMFHGGSWLRTTKESMMNSFCLPYLRHGFVVCNVEYRLSPVAKAPAAIEDALKAARWFFDHAEQYGADTNRIVITGASAGSHLGMMAGMATESAKLGPVSRPALIVNCYGVTDVADLLDGPHKKSWARQWLPEEDGWQELARRVSPLTYVRKGLPPILTVHGGSDTTVPTEHAFKLTEALRTAGVETDLMVVTNAKHGFTREEWPAVHERIFKFINDHGIATSSDAAALSTESTPAFSLVNSPGPDDFVLFDGSKPTAFLVETNDSPSVLRAAADFSEDVARVCGLKAPLIQTPPTARMLVIAGTLGLNHVVDNLAATGKLDTSGVAGQWESYVLQIVDHPLPDVDRALVVAGSDRRGTIYGIYELSELIGVSPWYWWADVPVRHRPLIALRGSLLKQLPPAVKYRGVFLNDEDWGLRPWASKTFEPGTGNIGPKTYASIFELLLRLRANYLWPAMHEDTPAFNSFATNKYIADLYGIVMGSSHCEQMLRDNVDEWQRDGTGEYNYVVNSNGVLKYWEDRVRENGRFENIYTVGMRGIHDGAMPGGGTPREKAARLHQIIGDQRGLLSRWVTPDPAAVPQIFCPYKEVLELYRLAPDIPGDITLAWPDDNFGYVRQFSDASEQKRTGGAGVYYHVSYYGRPQDYLWLCSTPPALIAEEMCKGFDYGANRVWILNVGDLKPAEIATEFFLKLAWNPHQWNGLNAEDLLEHPMARDFGPALAAELAGILTVYYRLNFQRKPEHMNIENNSPPQFSTVLNGDEAEARLNAWRALVKRTDDAGRKLPAEMQNAFFELIGYPVHGAALMNEKWLALTKYKIGMKQGRIAAFDLPAMARRAHEEIQRETDHYNELAGGKWRNMMSANPRKQSAFTMPSAPVPELPVAPATLGLVLEGNEQALLARADEKFDARLPEFNKLLPRSYFVDIFNAGTEALHWTAKPDEDWIKLDRTSGEGDARMMVNLDWAKVPSGEKVTGTIRFSSQGKTDVHTLWVRVNAFNPEENPPLKDADFVEDNQRIVMEAEHASEFIPQGDVQWQTIRGLGYNGEAVSVFPTTAAIRDLPEQIRKESPALKYHLWLRTPGQWTVTVRALPTFSVETGKPQRYAIALDDEPPHIVSLPMSQSERDQVWGQNVLRDAALASSTNLVQRGGLHTLTIWMVDPGIVIDTIAAQYGDANDLGYTWPAETSLQR